MANGGTLTELVTGGDRGRWAVLATVVILLAGGASWVMTKEGRDYSDGLAAAARTYADNRIRDVIESRRQIADVTHRALDEKIARIVDQIAKVDTEHDAEFRRVWEAVTNRITRDAIQDMERRLQQQIEQNDRDIDRIRERLYGSGTSTPGTGGR